MRRPALLVSFAVLAAVLLARRRRRAAHVPLAPARPATGLGPAEPGTRFVSVPWELVAAPADEPALTIRYRSGGELELDRIDAQETPTQVFVTVLLRRRPSSQAAGGEGEQEAEVALSRPLGARELIHAPVDEPSKPPLYP